MHSFIRREHNHGVGQGCPLSPTLFNVYINEIIVKWIHIDTEDINLSTITKINLIFCRRSRHKTWSRGKFTKWLIHNKNPTKYFGMEILPDKFEMMAFVVQDLVRCKIVLDNECWQQLKHLDTSVVITGKPSSNVGNF